MKVLVPMYHEPSRKNVRVVYINNLVEALRKKTPIKLIWVVYQPDKIVTFDEQNTSVYDLHAFSNSLEMLKTIKPDLVMVSPTAEPVNYSISLGAKLLKIPCIAYDYFSLPLTSITDHSENKNYSKFSTAKKFFSEQVATDSAEQKQFGRRGRFVLYKYSFYFKTKKALGAGFFQLIKFLFESMRSFNKDPPLNKSADLYFVTNESHKNKFVSEGLDENKVEIIGDLVWDKMYGKIYKKKTSNQPSNKIKLLIITDALYEHGLWSHNQRDEFLKNLFKELQKNENIIFSLKIHPTSENKAYYEKLLTNLGINSSIFQTEDLWEIINDFDMAISYGFSTSHSEIAYSGMKMILMDSGMELSKFPFVKEAISIGNIKECHDVKSLIPLIYDLKNQKSVSKEDFLKERDKSFFSGYVQPGKRATDAIFNLLNKKNQSIDKVV